MPAVLLIEPPLAPRLKITKFALLSRAAKIFGPGSSVAYIIRVLKWAQRFQQG